VYIEVYPKGTDLVIHSTAYPGNIIMISLAGASVVAVGVGSAIEAIVPHLIGRDSIVPAITDIRNSVSCGVTWAATSIDQGRTATIVCVDVPTHEQGSLTNADVRDLQLLIPRRACIRQHA
jgi:hypothetical protein